MTKTQLHCILFHHLTTLPYFVAVLFVHQEETPKLEVCNHIFIYFTIHFYEGEGQEQEHFLKHVVTQGLKLTKPISSRTTFSSLVLSHLHSPTLTITLVGTTQHVASPGLTYVVFGILFKPFLPLSRNHSSKLVTGESYLPSKWL